MPVWTVQTVGDDERVEAGLLAPEGGALVALSEEGLLVRAWAAGQWRTARQLTGVEAHPAGKADGPDAVLVGLPGL
jgi:hypothetical protein